jgi:hypothetical protein
MACADKARWVQRSLAWGAARRDGIPGDEEDAMRQSARFVAWSVSLLLLAACGTAPRAIELQPLKTLDHAQLMGQQDVGGLLDQAKQAASLGDKAKVLSLLHQARSSMGTAVMAEGSSMRPLAKQLEQSISQLEQAHYNIREVSSILVSQLQDSQKVLQKK